MGIEIREFQKGDEALLEEALAQACGPAGRDEWRWASQENPCGSRSFVALSAGRVLGHYACVPRQVWIAAHAAVFAEVAASFVLPTGPRGLQREGTYVRLCRALGQAYGKPGGDLVHYGFRGLPEWRVENGLCDYEVVRDQSVLLRALPEAEETWPAGVERLERFDHQAQWLWDRCAGDFGAAAIRDEAYLNWRFVGRPGVRYELLGARDAQGILRGAAVLRCGAFGGHRAAWLVDWIVPPAEPEVGELLQRAALALAREQGERCLATLLPEWSPWFEVFQGWGFLVHPGGVFLGARAFARKFDEVWLRDQWWFTLADSLVL